MERDMAPETGSTSAIQPKSCFAITDIVCIVGSQEPTLLAELEIAKRQVAFLPFQGEVRCFSHRACRVEGPLCKQNKHTQGTSQRFREEVSDISS